jgi:hypothetical protein
MKLFIGDGPFERGGGGVDFDDTHLGVDHPGFPSAWLPLVTPRGGAHWNGAVAVPGEPWTECDRSAGQAGLAMPPSLMKPSVLPV